MINLSMRRCWRRPSGGILLLQKTLKTTMSKPTYSSLPRSQRWSRSQSSSRRSCSTSSGRRATRRINTCQSGTTLWSSRNSGCRELAQKTLKRLPRFMLRKYLTPPISLMTSIWIYLTGVNEMSCLLHLVNTPTWWTVLAKIFHEYSQTREEVWSPLFHGWLKTLIR